MCLTKNSNFSTFLCQREIGKYSHHSNNNISEIITVNRSSECVLSKTSLTNKSTYLLRVNKNNKFIAAAHGDQTVSIYSTGNDSLIAICSGHERSPWTLAFHPSDPFILATGCLGGCVQLWNLACLSKFCDSDSECPTAPLLLDSIHVWKQAGAIASISFHPFYPILVVAWSQEVIFYDHLSGRTLSSWRFVSDHSRVRWVNMSPDGNLLYTATANPAKKALSISLSQLSKDTVPISAVASTEANKFDPTADIVDLENNEIPSVDFSQKKNIRNSAITRNELLYFLLNQPNSWYRKLGICHTCSLRLCSWAGNLGPIFPNSTSCGLIGLKTAREVALILASTMNLTAMTLPYTIKQLLKHTNESSDIRPPVSWLQDDPHPASVAVIEDLPTKEFLQSRGTYCRQESPGVFDDTGVCCDGHIHDLVLTHRQLMRYSLCRPCLQSFWSWSNGNIDWWTWNSSATFGGTLGTSSQFGEQNITPSNISMKVNDSDSNGLDSQSSVNGISPQVFGVCVLCSIAMEQSTTIMTPFSSVVNSPSAERSTQLGSSLARPHIVVQKAVLNLLRDRLHNAAKFTRTTFLAPTVVNDVRLVNRLKELLTRPRKNIHDVSSMLNHSISSSGDLSRAQSKSKRRRLMIDVNSTKLSFKSDKFKAGEHSILCLLKACQKVRSKRPTDPSVEVSLLAENRHIWKRNGPPPVIKSIESPFPPNTLSVSSEAVFDYVSLGTNLLHSIHNRQADDISAVCDSLKSNELLGKEPSADDSGMARSSENRVCCKCGCIVPYTFPLDLKTDLNQAVCTSLLFSRNSVTSLGGNSKNLTLLPKEESESASLRTEVAPEQIGRNTNSPNSATQNSLRGVLSLINRNSTNSVLNTMQQGITNVVTGLMTDVGEQSPVCNLRKTTYRICRWELKFCTASDSSSSYTKPCFYSPMPANLAVSYNRNSLLVPHVRIFNDSSICLSPDGRFLAAIVTSRFTNDSTSQFTSPQSKCSGSRFSNISSEYLLALYRLEPKNRRGHCVFARKFVNSNPVCLDFSPSSEFLVVGLSSNRPPNPSIDIASLSATTSTSLSTIPTLRASDLPVSPTYTNSLLPKTPVALIFKIHYFHPPNHSAPSTNLSNMGTIWHPRWMPQSTSNAQLSVEDWNRNQLLANDCLSVNTIVWYPVGGIIYGTTRGLVVMLKPKSLPISDPAHEICVTNLTEFEDTSTVFNYDKLSSSLLTLPSQPDFLDVNPQ